MSADTNEDIEGALAGAWSVSGTSPLSQNMWKTRSPTRAVEVQFSSVQGPLSLNLNLNLN